MLNAKENKFGKQEKDGGLPKGQTGLIEVVKGECLGFSVGMPGYYLLNFSRPMDIGDDDAQAYTFAFNLWRNPEFQDMLHKIAEKYPLQEKDIQPFIRD